MFSLFIKRRLLCQKETFGEYITEWVKIKKGVVEETTYLSYTESIENLIIKYKDYDLSNKYLSNLSPKVFQAYLNSLAKRYSQATIKKIWQIIKQCVKYGEIQKELKENLTVSVKIPLESNVAVKKKDIPFINEQQLNQLYNLLDNFQDINNIYRYKNSNNAHALILIAYTGMRIGELTALKWKNVFI